MSGIVTHNPITDHANIILTSENTDSYKCSDVCYRYEELEVPVNPEGLSIKTEFDYYGNPLRISDENGNTTSYEYDGRVTHYHYDEEGNLIFKEFKKPQGQGYHVWNKKLLNEKYDIAAKGSMTGWLYEWDSGGMLTKVINPHHGKIRFGYDALGRRLYKEVSHKCTRWLWNGNTPLHEWTETKEEPLIDMITWVFEDGTFVPTARITDKGTQSIVTDYLGTPTMAFDEDGKKVWERELDIYGRIKSESNAGLIPMTFQGMYQDVETGGLMYNRFRFFDSTTGTYISQDPIGLAGNNPTLYAYVPDPNSWIDPFGLECSIVFNQKANRFKDVKTGQFVAKKGSEQKITVYRVFGGDTRASGYSWSPVNPTTVNNYRNLAGLPSGGKSGVNNSADFMIKGQVKYKDIIKVRKALPLDGNVGGLSEFIIDPKHVTILDFLVLNP